jgi:hypothetical protein
VREMMLLAAGIVVIGGATFILMKGPDVVRQVQQVTTTGDKPADKKPEASATKGKSKRQSKPARNGAKEEAFINETPHLWVEVSTVLANPQTGLISDSVKAAVPEARDIPSGMPRSEVEKIYGRPTLSTIQTRSGRLLQKYVYVSKDKSTVTVAVLEDGRVLTALDMPQ